MNCSRLCAAVLTIIACLPAQARAAQAPVSLSRSKFAIVIIEPADSRGWSRFVMGLAYARRLKRAGADVRVFFDGMGVHWLSLEAEKPGAPPAGALPPAGAPAPSLFTKTQGALNDTTKMAIPLAADGAAVDRYQLRDKLKGTPATITDELDEIPRHVSQGYQLLIF